MIDYDSFSRCHLTDIFFYRFSHGSKRAKGYIVGSRKVRLDTTLDVKEVLLSVARTPIDNKKMYLLI